MDALSGCTRIQVTPWLSHLLIQCSCWKGGHYLQNKKWVSYFALQSPPNGERCPIRTVKKRAHISFFSISGVSLENFPQCKELLIPPGTQNYIVRMRMYDVNKRQMNLTIRIVCRAEGSLKIFISAPYWLLNKTGKSGLTSYGCKNSSPENERSA